MYASLVYPEEERSKFYLTREGGSSVERQSSVERDIYLLW